MFEENGTVYKTGTLDRLDHDTAYVQVDADADGDTEKEVLGWICSRVAAVEQHERREMPARSGRCASGRRARQASPICLAALCVRVRSNSVWGGC